MDLTGQLQVCKIANAESARTHDIVLGKGWVDRAKWSPDGQRPSPPPWERLFFIFNAQGEIAATFPNHRTSVSDFAWNPKNFSEIATVCGGGAQMWRIGEAEPYARF